MEISYNWLCDYLSEKVEVKELEEILTSIGLEVGSVEEHETIKGGLKGIVIGKVLECGKHPDSDHLSKTLVDVGAGEPLPIVCGAPNVAKDQTVVVATVGTILYDQTGKEFEIKKAKIRGEVSMGMICAEDEIGVGQSHAGIMVLPNDVKIGTLAKDYFNVKSDVIIEVDITPNRIDGASHIGVARDVAAYLRKTRNISYKCPCVDDFKVDNTSSPLTVEVLNNEACPRYSGVSISGVTIKESPEWLKDRLKAIGLNPINNVVDITNYVLFETGQPLHAFDAAQITGNKLIVKTLPDNTEFVTLDGVARKLSSSDLMICNKQEGMCIAGVFGGQKSGISNDTKDIFLESAYFNPVWVRKTAKRHGLSTDSSFRFERGADPNIQIYALKRAANLVKEIAGGQVSSEIIDIYPNKIENCIVDIKFQYINDLIGKTIPMLEVKNILESLEIKVLKETEEALSLEIPAYRVDVTRPADVVEEILRIYGYNNVEFTDRLNSAIVLENKPESHRLQNELAEFLASNGFNEVMNNSLTKLAYYEALPNLSTETAVKIINPLSSDLNAMRQTLLFGMLENTSLNYNFKQKCLKLFEFGNTYHLKKTEDKDVKLSNCSEYKHLSILVSGDVTEINWYSKSQKTNFHVLKSFTEFALKKLNINKYKIEEFENDLMEGIVYKHGDKRIAEVGIVKKSILKGFDVNQAVYFADINWNIALSLYSTTVKYVELPKYPEVERDLSLLIDANLKFAQFRDAAMSVEKQLLKKLTIVDIYQGKGIEDGKKSYTLNFTFRDDNATLQSNKIDGLMDRIIKEYQNKFGAVLR